jgi:hypothetical protein
VAHVGRSASLAALERHKMRLARALVHGSDFVLLAADLLTHLVGLAIGLSAIDSCSGVFNVGSELGRHFRK